MNSKKLIYAILAAAVAIALVVLLVKIVSGAFGLLSGAVNAVLGIAVVAALVVIVVWMFAYARRRPVDTKSPPRKLFLSNAPRRLFYGFSARGRVRRSHKPPPVQYYPSQPQGASVPSSFSSARAASVSSSTM